MGEGFENGPLPSSTMQALNDYVSLSLAQKFMVYVAYVHSYFHTLGITRVTTALLILLWVMCQRESLYFSLDCH